jgi:hypothetical protein
MNQSNEPIKGTKNQLNEARTKKQEFDLGFRLTQ